LFVSSSLRLSGSRFEATFGQSAYAHLFVTNAMHDYLVKEWDLQCVYFSRDAFIFYIKINAEATKRSCTTDLRLTSAPPSHKRCMRYVPPIYAHILK
jgi:hypothetical protein